MNNWGGLDPSSSFELHDNIQISSDAGANHTTPPSPNQQLSKGLCSYYPALAPFPQPYLHHGPVQSTERMLSSLLESQNKTFTMFEAVSKQLNHLENFVKTLCPKTDESTSGTFFSPDEKKRLPTLLFYIAYCINKMFNSYMHPCRKQWLGFMMHLRKMYNSSQIWGIIITVIYTTAYIKGMFYILL